MLVHPNIAESLLSTDHLSFAFTLKMLKAAYFTDVPKFCLDNLVKLNISGMCASKLFF